MGFKGTQWGSVGSVLGAYMGCFWQVGAEYWVSKGHSGGRLGRFWGLTWDAFGRLELNTGFQRDTVGVGWVGFGSLHGMLLAGWS